MTLRRFDIDVNTYRQNFFLLPVDFGAPDPFRPHPPHVTPAAARAEAVLLRGRAVAWARSYGLPAATAEDVAHDALEVLLRRAPDVEPDKAAAFLRQTVLNKAREAKRRPVAEPVEQAADAPDAEDTLVSVEMRRRVQEALLCIPPSRRDVVRLVSIDGRSVPEVAAEERLPESTVRARLRDGTEDLRAELHRQRVAEKRKSGFASWLAAWGLLDVRWRRWLPVLGATAAGGALATLPTERLAVTPDERPAVAFEVAPVSQPVTSWAERGTARPEMVRERTRHDAGRRFRAERFGVE